MDLLQILKFWICCINCHVSLLPRALQFGYFLSATKKPKAIRHPPTLPRWHALASSAPSYRGLHNTTSINVAKSPAMHRQIHRSGAWALRAEAWSSFKYSTKRLQRVTPNNRYCYNKYTKSRKLQQLQKLQNVNYGIYIYYKIKILIV